MLSGNVSKIIVLGVALMLGAAIVHAQQKVYKWVDEDGVVHFSDSPPDDSAIAETITTEPAPTPTEAPARALHKPVNALPPMMRLRQPRLRHRTPRYLPQSLK